MKKPVLLKILDVVTLIAVLGATAMVFFYAPVERVMGAVQKVFYFHVAAGWVGMVSFFLAAISGVLFLIKKSKILDVIGATAIEIGIVFTMINVITGSIWARPIWNTWWTWDPRLTTATIMELVYIAYIMLRQGIDDPEKRARFGAVYAIVGFLSVPITFFSIRIFRTIHPVVIAGSDSSALGTFDMTAAMFQTLMVSIVVFSILFIDLVLHRVRLGMFAYWVEEQKMLLED